MEMHKDLQQRLLQRWPHWFDLCGDTRLTLIAFGFQHGDGWFDILWRLGEDLESLVREFEAATGQKFEVLQVKEKFGGLRIYVSEANDAIRQRLERAISESFRTCEVCAQQGERREGNWIKTLCDEHARLP
jgi:hypothetical protein